MEKQEALFLRTKITWKTVVLLAVCCGVTVGLLMIPEFLTDTSFQQPGISFEFWIFAALFIILRCERPWEAGCKTFVFFLISQPLIYLVQVPVTFLHWGIFRYYPQWGVITLLTLPGGALGWYVKKGNLLSVLLLAAVDGILCLELPGFVRDLLSGFPRFLLSTAFIVWELVFFQVLLFRKRMRVLSFFLTALLLAASVTYYLSA
ncbi:MAG: hypothetical protein IKQ69_02260 [Oscillospiraceae bacterium]|nr:hypothetical protein [Oscillospiraceae bacterium]